MSSTADLSDPSAVVPLPNVSGRILAKVIEYCKFHTEAKPKGEGEKSTKSEEDIKTFDTEFVKVDQGTLFELILVRAILGCIALPGACACLTVDFISAAAAGCELPKHQESPRPDLLDRGKHDQGCVVLCFAPACSASPIMGPANSIEMLSAAVS